MEDGIDTLLVLDTASDILEIDRPGWCCGMFLALRFGPVTALIRPYSNRMTAAPGTKD